MFGNHDYYAIIRKYVTLIGTMFSDIIIERDASDGSQSALITVPVTYGPKDKMIARMKQDPNIDRQTAISTLPLISFELKTMGYDGDRHLNTLNKVSYKNDANNSRYQYNFVAYDFKFNVYVYIKNTPTTIGGELTDAETLVDTEVLAPVKAEASVVVADVKKVV